MRNICSFISYLRCKMNSLLHSIQVQTQEIQKNCDLRQNKDKSFLICRCSLFQNIFLVSLAEDFTFNMLGILRTYY